MKLITAHRILISAAIAFFILYALVQLRVFLTRDGGASALVQVAAAAVIAVALVVYYRSLRGWGQR